MQSLQWKIPKVHTMKSMKQKFSTQSTKTIEAFWQKYHTKLEDFNDEVQAITYEFTKALDDLIAKSFAKWKWSSDKDHKADIKE